MKFAYLTLFGSLTPESIKLLEWEQSFLGLELVKSMLVGGGVGLSTNSFKQFKKGDTIAQFLDAFWTFQNLQRMKFFIHSSWAATTG